MKERKGHRITKRPYKKALKRFLCMVVSFLIATSAMYIVPMKASAGANWVRQASGTTINLNSVCYGNGKFVAVGDLGTIITSTDGNVWTSIPPMTIDALLDVTTNGNGVFVAVGRNGTILYSVNNGNNWYMSVTTPSITNTTGCIGYGNGVFMAVFDNRCYVASYDDSKGLSTWLIRGYSPLSINDVTFGNGRFWAVGTNIMSSVDGAVWSVVSSGTGALNTINYNGSYYMSVGDNGRAYMTFENGSTYDVRTVFTSYNLRGVAYGQINGKVFFAAVGDNLSGGTIITSETAVSWEDRTGEFIPAGTLPLNGVCYGSGIFVCVGYGGTILTSGGVSSPPQFTSVNTASCSENAVYTNYTAAAVPANGTIVTYSMCGSNDDYLFAIDPSTGVLTFKSSPDYENPQDYGRDNTYIVTVRAADSLRSADQGVTVKVTDVNELPSAITGQATQVGPYSAVLNGTVNGNGISTSAYFQYGTTISYGTQAALTKPSGGIISGFYSIPVEAVLTGLNTNTTYHYRVVANNPSGITYGVDRMFTTLNVGVYTAEASISSGAVNAGGENTVTFTVKNSSGATDTSFSGTYNVTLKGAESAPNGTYGSFGGTMLTTAAESTGQAVPVSFSNGTAIVKLILNKADEQSIGFRIYGVMSSDTNSISITPLPGMPDSMCLSQDIAAPAANGVMLAMQPIILLKDAFGNICTNDSSTVISTSKGDGGSWSLMGTLTKTSASGIAAFGDLAASNSTAVSGAWLKFSSPGLSDIASSTITLPAPIIYALEILPMNATVNPGSAQLFTASVTGENTPSQEVVWNVTGNNKVGTTISSSGLLTVAADETATTVTITATSTVDGSKYGTVTVNIPKYITGISVKSLPDKTIYMEGQSLELKGAAITLTYSDGSLEVIDIEPSMVGGFDSSKAGKQTVTVSCQGKTTGFEVNVMHEKDKDENPDIIDNPETGSASLPAAFGVAVILGAASVFAMKKRKGIR